MELDKTVLLIYHWLKEHQLLKTCACLEQEYGKTVLDQEKPLCTLNQILQALSTLIFSLSNSEETLSTFMSSLTNSGEQTGTRHAVESKRDMPGNSRKRKTSPKKESTAESTDDFSADTNNNILTNTKVVTKKVKVPLVPPGQWACPEMESTLLKVYERTMLSIIDVNKINSLPELSSETQADKNDNSNIKTENNIENVIPENSKGSSNMFTSDSESDSGDDFPKSNTISKLTSGIVVIVPGTPCKETNIENKGNTQDVVELQEIQVKKKKKKKVLELYNNGEPNAVVKEKKRNDFEDIHVGEENVVEKSPKIAASGEREGKKQKKKTDVDPPVSGGNDMEKSPKDEVGEHKEVKKKKKKKASNTDDIYNTVSDSTPNNGEDVPGSTSPPVKKKKKKSLERESKENELTPKVDSTPTNGLDVPGGTSPPVKKKKKKLERERKETELTPKVENEITKTKEENYTNSQAENNLALSGLCDTLKKKKKKKKNVVYGQ